jgi:hypothetical protein
VVVMKSTIFWDTMLCSLLKVNWHFRGTYHLHLQGRRISRATHQHESRWQGERLCLPLAFTLVSCSAFSLTLKMEAICSSELSIDFQWTALCYIPEDSTLLVKPQFSFRFFDRNQEGRRSILNGSKHSPNLICSYFLHEHTFDLLLAFLEFRHLATIWIKVLKKF